MSSGDQMPRSGNGTGTAYYGRSSERDDGSYVTTVWIVIFYLPIFPLRSERVLPHSVFRRGFGFKRYQYRVLHRVLLDRPSVVRTFLIGWGVLFWYVCLSFVYDFVAHQFWPGSGPVFALLWLGLPFLLWFLGKKWFCAKPILVEFESVPGSGYSVYERARYKDKKRG
jgi:hypothetical protein